MDRHALAILIPVIGVFFTGLIAFSFTRLDFTERALTRQSVERIITPI